MHVEEEVELNIQTEVSGMKGSTRAPMEITEKISSIVALAFDGSNALIKKVDAVLTPTNDYVGTLKIKVPKRTQTIHFLGNYKTTDIESITTLETLNNFTTSDVTTMHYWGTATYNGGNNLSVTLHRNMAKLTLKKGEGFTANSCYIAGFVNRNLSGTIVPSEYAVGDTPTIPDNVQTETHVADNSLGNVYYLFEHANVENSGPLYVILEIAAKYYKVAFAAGDTYFPIIRNHEYTIAIDGIDAMYAENNYLDAVNSQYPINDLVITSVPMTVTASPAAVLNESGQTCTVTVIIPEGITELNVPTHDAFDITPPNGLTEQNGKYTVTPGSNYAFTFAVEEEVEAGDKTISFSGRGKYKSATGTASINLYEMEEVTLEITPSEPTVGNTQGSTTQLTVQIPVGITSLSITTGDFDVATPEGVTLENGTYNVSSKQGQPVTFTLTLKANGTAGETKSVTFAGSGQKKTATGTATVTLQNNALANVNLAVEVIDEDADNPSMIYGQNSEEDLYVKVTIPAGVTTLTLNSEYFDIASASDLKKEGDVGEAYLSVSGNSYTVNHQGEESITLPFRLRLKSSVPNTSASFTFTGTGATINEASTTKNVTLEQRNPDDGSVYWEGYLPLNQADNTTKISIPKDKLGSVVGRVMRIESKKTQDNQALALLNNWTQFNPDMQYSSATIDVPLTQDFVNSITDNLIITGRGAEGMLMKKVSFLQLQTVKVTATPSVTSLNYSENSVSDLIVNVEIPAGVSTLDFSSDYFEVGVVDDRHLTDNGDGSYTRTDNNQISTYVRLRLNNKTETQNAGFTFSGKGNNLYVVPAEVNNITLTERDDANVRWQGDALLDWDNDGPSVQIPLPYSWFEGIPVGSKLRVEYETIQNNGAVIQFTEVKSSDWTQYAYFFEELSENNGDYGLNLNENTGIYKGNSFDLTLTETILNQMNSNRTTFQGMEDIVMAIQGGNVRLKSISVIPQTFTGNILVALPNGDAQSAVSTSLDYASGEGSFEEFTLDVTVPDGVTQIAINAADFDVRTEPTSTITTYTFGAEERTKRFKFTLKSNSKSDKNSKITISDNSGNAASATVTVDLSLREADTNGTFTVWSGLMALDWTRNYLAVNSYLPIGTKVTLNFTSGADGGAFEMQDCNESVFRLKDVSYPENDDYIGVGAGTNNYLFTITDQTTIKNSNNGYDLISNAINGLRINGSGLVMTSIVVDYSGVAGGTFAYDFEDSNMAGINGWGNSSTREIVTENENKVLKLYNPSSVNSYDVQVAFDRIFVPGSYTLTYRIKGDSTGTIDQGFQYFFDPIETDSQYKNASGFPQTTVTAEWQDVTIPFTVTRAGNRFLLNIGQFVGNIYIDDIELVKNN